MNRQDDPQALISFLFFKPKSLWKRAVCWVLGVEYHHVSIHMAESADMHYVLDYPKGRTPRVVEAMDFIKRTNPDLIVPYMLLPKNAVMSVLSGCWTTKNKRWPSLKYQIRKRWGRVKNQERFVGFCNCSTWASLLATNEGGVATPDELLKRLRRE
jgi:hypothetical protein